MKQTVTQSMWNELIEKLGEDLVSDYCQKIDNFSTNLADKFPTPLEHYKDEMRKRHEQRNCSDLLKLFDEPKPLKIDNTKPNRCGMCGIKTKKLYPRMVGKINFYICGFCKSIMEEGEEHD